MSQYNQGLRAPYLAIALQLIGGLFQIITAQSLQPKVVGDTVQDVTFTKVINYNASTAKRSDFSGRMVILEFWSTSCVSCIESWPKLIALQEKFKDSVQFILVNAYQEETTVRKIFDKRKKLTGLTMNIPTVCGDSSLARIFPHLGVPHVVWIDADGIVRAKTDIAPLTAKNVSRMLKDPSFSLPAAWTSLPARPDLTQPLFVNGNGGDGKAILQYAVLGTYLENQMYSIGMSGKPKSREYERINAINASVANLYAFAYSMRRSPSGTPYTMLQNRLRFEGFDTLEYKSHIDGIHQPQNHYCYQLITRPSREQELQRLMQQDLHRYFGYEVGWQKKRTLCRVLRVEDSTRISAPNTRGFMQGVSASFFSLNGAFTFREAVWFLENMNTASPVPILNEVTMKGNPWGIEIEVDVKDFDKLEKALQPYGITFRQEYREIDILIIRKPATVPPRRVPANR